MTRCNYCGQLVADGVGCFHLCPSSEITVQPLGTYSEQLWYVKELMRLSEENGKMKQQISDFYKEKYKDEYKEDTKAR